MPEWTQNYSNEQGMMLGLAVGGAILCLTIMLTLAIFIRRNARIQSMRARMEEDQQPIDGPKRTIRLWHEGKEITTSVSGGIRALTLSQRLNKIKQDAGWTMPATSMLLSIVGVAILAFSTVFVLFANLLGALGVAICVMIGFYIRTRQRIAKRRSVFERQFVDALELIARSLQAGHPLLGAFQLCAEELDNPIQSIFSDICQKHELGEGIEDAMQNVANEAGNEDLKLFATTVSIQLRSGGNLADMMKRLAFVIRERIRLGRRVQVLTAQTQFSKRILIALPFFVFVMLYLLSPRYMQPLYDTPLGHILIVLGVGSLIIGTWMMNKLARLEY